MIFVYGLKNCSTCRKAIKWLETQGRDAALCDLRRDPIEAKTLEKWIDVIGWEALLNRRGKTWRNLLNLEKKSIDKIKSHTLMLAYPALIRRPVFVYDGHILVGFRDKEKAVLRASVQ